MIFIVNLIIFLVILGLCIFDAYPGRDNLVFLGSAIVYGVILEQLVILEFSAYNYPVKSYLLTFGDVPLVIGFGWGAIIYSAYYIGREFDLGNLVVPFFVGLFVLHIDLAMDAVAIRVGFWNWTPPGPWFGVPLGNFFGWYFVGFFFCFMWRQTEKYLKTILIPTIVIPISVGLLILVLQIWVNFITSLYSKILVLCSIIFISLLIIYISDKNIKKISRSLVVVPFIFHIYFIVLLFVFGVWKSTPILIVVSGSMLVIFEFIRNIHILKKWISIIN